MQTRECMQTRRGWESVACCSYCGASHRAVRICLGCNSRAYCDKECQRKHWTSGHENECKELKKAFLKVYTPEGQLRPGVIDEEALRKIAPRTRSGTVFGAPAFFDFSPTLEDEIQLGLFKWRRGLLHHVDKSKTGSKEDHTKVPSAEGGDACPAAVAAAATVEAREPGTSGFYWDGPEEHSGALDLLVWKPLSQLAPALVRSVGAERAAELVQTGRPLPVPEALEPKRTFGHEWAEKNLVSGGTGRYRKAENSLAYANVDVRDLLTGVSLYSFDTKKKSFTDPAGHGSNQVRVQLERLTAKLQQLKLGLAQIESDEAAVRRKIEEYARLGPDVAKEHVPALERELLALSARRDRIQIRQRAERKELVEVQEQHEHSKQAQLRAHREEAQAQEKKDLIRKHGIPVPEALGLVLPKEALMLLSSGEAASQPETSAAGHTEPPLMHEAATVATGGMAEWLLSWPASEPPEPEHAGERYFGMPLIDPVSGQQATAVVKRQNLDQVLRAREQNKALADVLLARSDGKSRAAAGTGRPTLQQRRAEQTERKCAQGVTNGLVLTCLDQDIFEARRDNGKTHHTTPTATSTLSPQPSADADRPSRDAAE